MNIVNVTLLAIGAPLLILLSAIPTILLLKGWGAWRNLPPEVYASEQQRFLGLKPSTFWIAAAIINQAGSVYKWLGRPQLERIADNISFVILASVLIYHLFWAIHIIRSRVSMDTRLVSFARYALWGSASWLLFTAVGLVVNLTLK